MGTTRDHTHGSVTATERPPTANDRFKERAHSWFWGSLSAAAVVHFLFFAFLPALQASDSPSEREEVELLDVFEVDFPEPPEEILRPATPVMSPDEIDTEVTIPKTDPDAWGPEDLPDPPSSDRGAENTPTFTPIDVNPVLLNPDEVSSALERAYPRVLRDAGIGGTVLVWFFINADGEVENTQVNQSSGHQQLDNIAIDIAELYEFSPALNRDQRVSVWVSIPIHFESR